MNINQHKFMSLVPMSRIGKDFDYNLGVLSDIEIIGKGTLIGCKIIGEFAYTISEDKSNMIIINIKKGKPYIKILRRN